MGQLVDQNTSIILNKEEEILLFIFITFFI